jgi:autotransporter-associated beta strand protein
MFFGLGSEIAGTAVTRSIAKWFKGGPMALAMGLQLAIARLGTAFALVLSPLLVAEQTNHVYTLQETARPALVGMGLMALGLILWAFFVALDAGFDKRAGEVRQDVPRADETFRFKDVLGVLGNRNFWLLGLLCVCFYSTVIAFKKFAGAILIPRFDIPASAAGWMVSMLPFSTVIFAPLFGMLVDKAGKGTLTLNNTNAYKGATVLHDGVLEFSSLKNGGENSAIGSSTEFAQNWIADGGTYRYTGGTTTTNRSMKLSQT